MRPSLGVWTVESGVVASRAREGASGSARGGGEGRGLEEDEPGAARVVARHSPGPGADGWIVAAVVTRGDDCAPREMRRGFADVFLT